MRRNIEMIGSERVKRAPVVTDLGQLSLDNSSPSRLLDTAAASLLGRFPPLHESVDLETRDGGDLGYPSKYTASHEGEPAKIIMSNEILTDPLRTVMELAYQYSSHYWHGIQDPAPLDTDPRTTTLLPICCSLGVLASDASLYDQQWSQAGYAGWSISRSGYYTAVEIGYSLALLARYCGQEEPAWERRLRLDSRETAKNARLYFAEQAAQGGKLLFDAERIPSSSSDINRLAQWLEGDDPAFALAAAYALCKFDQVTPNAIASVLIASRAADRDLLPLAARLLGRGQVSSPVVEKRIRELIRDAHPATAIAAIESADKIGISVVEYRARVAKLLDTCSQDPFTLLKVIGNQRSGFASFERQLCEHLTNAIRAADGELTSALLECLRRVVDEPRLAIERRIRSPEIRRKALQYLDASG